MHFVHFNVADQNKQIQIRLQDFATSTTVSTWMCDHSGVERKGCTGSKKCEIFQKPRKRGTPEEVQQKSNPAQEEARSQGVKRTTEL